MTKFRVIVVVLLIALVLSACGSKAETTPEATEVVEVATDVPAEVEATAETSEEVQTSNEEPVNFAEATCRTKEYNLFPYPAPAVGEWSLGPDDAPVSIIVYSDFQCPYCAMMDPMINELYNAHPDEIQVVFRHFALDYHDKALPAAYAVEAVANLKQDAAAFFEFGAMVFAAQSEWGEMTVEDFETWLLDLAVETYDLDRDALLQAMNSETVAAKVAMDIDSGAGFVTGTPFVLFNGMPIQYMNVDSMEGAFRAAKLMEERQFDDCPEVTVDASKQYLATFKTTKGDFTAELFAKSAPLTVNSFIFLAENGYYINVPFHRVIEDFVAQAGDPTGSGTYGPGYEFDNEIDPALAYDKEGLLGMANAGANTNGSQFFITYAEQPTLTGSYTIFGQVVDGMDVVNALQRVDPQNDTEPVQVDLILSIEIEEK
ncbi:MAG: peptidylprolyl isomerase [Anaerolineaceae bacterium]|nr:peptidylprolyl isomerase [Anaerolineaceae bacterium]